MRVEFVNPFVAATCDVFKTMLSCTLTRGTLSLKRDHVPMYEVSGLIGLSGSCRGVVVLSVGRTTAMKAAEVMLGTRPLEVDHDVVDAIGELTNMVAGAAKSRLAEYHLSLGLPTVICGKTQAIAFPSQVSPMIIPFDSDIGPICVQVGLVERSPT